MWRKARFEQEVENLWSSTQSTKQNIARRVSGLASAFTSNMGVKQGCSLCSTLLGLCIDRLEEMIAEIASE